MMKLDCRSIGECSVNLSLVCRPWDPLPWKLYHTEQKLVQLDRTYICIFMYISEASVRHPTATITTNV